MVFVSPINRGCAEMSVCLARQLPPNCQSPFIPQKARNRLFALIMLVFATATLEAQTLAPTQLQEFNTAVQPATRLETYRQPVIPTVGRSGFIGHEGPHAVTIETVVALGVAYVVLGGIILALAASFRLLSDKIDSFFALLIPEPVPRSLRARGRRGSVFPLGRVTAVAEERQFSQNTLTAYAPRSK
jgi:hypothetical protein